MNGTGLRYTSDEIERVLANAKRKASFLGLPARLIALSVEIDENGLHVHGIGIVQYDDGGTPPESV